jgi:hypothetical protein
MPIFAVPGTSQVARGAAAGPATAGHFCERLRESGEAMARRLDLVCDAAMTGRQRAGFVDTGDHGIIHFFRQISHFPTEIFVEN